MSPSEFGIRKLPSAPFFVGVIVGFAICCGAGRAVSHRKLFEDFVRFTQPIQPQRYFYPTASELASHIRHTVSPEANAVLVGGASYFRGTGQNPGELWSLDLQRRLGRGYSVVNFAIDQAGPTSFAAVAFEILAREYPKLIYVTNGNPVAAEAPDGGDVYRYVFWDAYYKGMLPEVVAGAEAVRRQRRKELADPAGLELHLGKAIDSVSYACDLWTTIGYNTVFTVWSDGNPLSPFRARRMYREGDDSDMRQHQLDARADRKYAAISEERNRDFTRDGFVRPANGRFEIDRGKWDGLAREWEEMFPAELRPRCYIVLLRANPYFTRSYSESDRTWSETIYSQSQRSYEKVGYRVVSLRAEDLTADDYVDAGHFMASGGRKVAAAVARRIEEIASARGDAVRPSGPGPIDLGFALPSGRNWSEEPLVSISPGRAARTERLFLRHEPGQGVRLGYAGGEGAAPVYSPPIAWGAGATHALRISASGLYPVGEGLLKRWLLVRLDGAPFWEVPVEEADEPQGRVLAGNAVSLSRPPSTPGYLSRNLVGGARVRIRFERAMAGRSFPLVATGRTGQGDVLSIRVSERGAATFAYDHWNDSLAVSGESPFGFGKSHDVEFRVPGLSGGGGGDLEVRVDGDSVWRRRVPFYAPDPDNVFFGRNPIGATTAEPLLEGAAFEGVLDPSWEGE